MCCYRLPCIARSLIGMTSALILAACATTSSVSQDLISYVNQGILGIAPIEAEALNNKVIPRYGEFVQLLRQIHSPSEEVNQLHQFYLSGAEKLEKGFRVKMLGLETRNDGLVSAGNQSIESGRRDTEKWREELAKMYAKHGVAQKDEPKKN